MGWVCASHQHWFAGARVVATAGVWRPDGAHDRKAPVCTGHTSEDGWGLQAGQPQRAALVMSAAISPVNIAGVPWGRLAHGKGCGDSELPRSLRRNNGVDTSKRAALPPRHSPAPGRVAVAIPG